MKKIIMYASSYCPYCNMALALLKQKGVDISLIQKILIDKDEKLKQQMIELTKRKTVPQIFIGELHIGGYQDLQALENAGKLSEMLI